ncbi:MAG: hypothetical protein LBM96_11855 [Methanobrevibacter sp.]|jgi:rRNA-processing protein FCF1|nr:hypothetical protein [Candidatus Methanoflexus mossambicus]
MMMSEIDEFIQNTNKIILDTELFLLFLAGLNNINTIEKIKATKKFTKKDFETLKKIVKEFNDIKTTPHILTEISNLNKHKYYRKKLFECMEYLINENLLDEKFIDIQKLIKDKKFKHLGVADMGIKELSKKQNYGVITADFGLYNELKANNINCINFNRYMEINN